jgi:hypothetical protein
MPFTIQSDDLAGVPARQSVWYSTDIDILVVALAGTGVLTGCNVTAQGSPDMTLAVASGTIQPSAGVGAVTVTAGNVTITTAHATLPRIDLVTASAAGVKTVTAGTAAAEPKPPDLPSGHIALAMVDVPAADTAIQTAQITSKRAIVAAGAAAGMPMGLTGAVSPTRYADGTASAAPTSGTFAVGDFIVTQAGGIWICTGAGTPGTWVAVSGVGGLSDQGVITYLDGTVAAAPGTPASGKLRIYAKTGKVLAVLDDTGAETILGAAGSGTITTKDEGSTLSAGVTTIDFVGAGVTASGAGATTTVTIPGAGSIASVTGVLSGDVSMTAAHPTTYAGPSVSCGAGTWLIIGTIVVLFGAANTARFSFSIYDGSAKYASAAMEARQAFTAVTQTVVSIVTLASPATMSILAESDATAGTTKMLQNAPGYGSTGTMINAIKLA